MEVLTIWIIITELPNINTIVTFTKRVQIQLRSVNHLVILWVMLCLHSSVYQGKH